MSVPNAWKCYFLEQHQGTFWYYFFVIVYIYVCKSIRMLKGIKIHFRHLDSKNDNTNQKHIFI